MPLNRIKLFTISMWTLTVVHFVVLIYYWPYLPEKVAIHFNALGEADNWTSKTGFLFLSMMVLIFTNGLFQVIITNLPSFPKELVNIPNRDYWFGEERREATVKKAINYLLWLANITCLFLVGLFYLIIQVNYYHASRLGNAFWILFVVYLIAFVFLTFEMMIFFFKVPKDWKKGASNLTK